MCVYLGDRALPCGAGRKRAGYSYGRTLNRLNDLGPSIAQATEKPENEAVWRGKVDDEMRVMNCVLFERKRQLGAFLFS